MLAICLIGALVVAFLGSRDTPGWAARLGDSWFDHQLRNIAGSWDNAMEALRLTEPHEALRVAMGRALDWRWDGASD